MSNTVSYASFAENPMDERLAAEEEEHNRRVTVYIIGAIVFILSGGALVFLAPMMSYSGMLVYVAVAFGLLIAISFYGTPNRRKNWYKVVLAWVSIFTLMACAYLSQFGVAELLQS